MNFRITPLLTLLAQCIARANILALDFCLGALISTYVVRAMHKGASWQTMLIGGILGVLPDFLDYFTQPLSKWIRGREYDHHLLPTHWPLLMIPVAGTFSWIHTHDCTWVYISCGALGSHYVHDMIGRYSGVRLLAPISFKYFGTNGIEEPHHSKRARYMRSHSTQQWIDAYWMRPSTLCMTELALAFVCSVVLVCTQPEGVWVFALSILSFLGLGFCLQITRRLELGYS
ncbi:MAG TPA: metal-dependent hydrolase [Candidatus Paceibacterota bacterium]